MSQIMIRRDAIKVIVITSDKLRRVPQFVFAKGYPNLDPSNLTAIMLVKVASFKSWGLWVNCIGRKRFKEQYNPIPFLELFYFMEEMHSRRVTGEVSASASGRSASLRLPEQMKEIDGRRFADEMDDIALRFEKWLSQFSDSYDPPRMQGRTHNERSER